MSAEMLRRVKAAVLQPWVTFSGFHPPYVVYATRSHLAYIRVSDN